MTDQTPRPRTEAGRLDTTTWLCGSPPNTGQRQRYPGRFIANVWRTYPEMMQGDSLTMFAGAFSENVGYIGTTTDIREETGADIIAPFDAIPRADESFGSVLADPPYADHWQGEWHGDLPKPKHILAEAVRLTRTGGLVGILHIIVIPAYKSIGVQRIALHPVLAGPNNAIRVFNVFRVVR